MLNDSGVVAHVAVTTTQPMPDCLYPGCSIGRADVQGGGLLLLLLTRKTHTQLKLVRNRTRLSLLASSRHQYVSRVTPLSSLLQPILDGRKTKQRCKKWATNGQQIKDKTKAHSLVLPSHRQKNLQLNSVTSLTRDSDKRSLPSEEKGMSEPPHTALLSVEILPRADCKHDAQTSSARSSPQCAHLPQRFSASETFHRTKGNGK